MPRPKGSKNKVKATKVTADFAAQIAAKQEEKAAVEAEILKVAASIEELKTDVKSLNADLKAKKASVKKLDKEVAKLEARQAAAAQKAAEASKKAEAEDVLKKLLASGVSADEILEKLKKYDSEHLQRRAFSRPKSRACPAGRPAHRAGPAGNAHRPQRRLRRHGSEHDRRR